ncbi:acid sphingomyelinase-like phosphodiesterase 3b [Grus japonensis]|uniref:Acid sphingomyelinase-like phosphodiesterase 3b n=1 Tax=Grus japonensis TaxID=30415 RepID=A0ABC9WEV7_GRUJA
METAMEREVRICERNSFADTQVSEEGGGGGAPGAGTEIPLQPLEKTMDENPREEVPLAKIMSLDERKKPTTTIPKLPQTCKWAIKKVALSSLCTSCKVPRKGSGKKTNSILMTTQTREKHEDETFRSGLPECERGPQLKSTWQILFLSFHSFGKVHDCKLLRFLSWGNGRTVISKLLKKLGVVSAKRI